MMAKREKKSIHKVQMTERKRQIIQQLLQEYDIETAEDIHDAFKELDYQKARSLCYFRDKPRRKDVLTIEVGENESAKYWLSVLNGLNKPRSQGYPDYLY